MMHHYTPNGRISQCFFEKSHSMKAFGLLTFYKKYIFFEKTIVKNYKKIYNRHLVMFNG